LRGFHKAKEGAGDSNPGNSYLLSDIPAAPECLADIYEADATTLQDVILTSRLHQGALTATTNSRQQTKQQQLPAQ
jgi:hypothetical protein